MSERPRRAGFAASTAAIAIVAGAALLTGWLALTTPTGPAAFELGAPRARDVTGQVVVDLTNVGGRTAEVVTVRITLPDGSEIEQDAAWVSPGETEHLTFVVPDRTEPSDLEAAVISFDEAR